MDWTPIGSLFIATLAFLLSIYNNGKKNTKEDTTQIATLIVKLDKVGEDIHDMKRDLSDLRRSQQEQLERLIIVEQSLNTAWIRIDELTGKKERDHHGTAKE